nr:hypothetical protein [uncultured Acetatifactor sp.]
MTECAEAVAEKVAGLIRRFVPEHLMGEWEFASALGIGNVLVRKKLEKYKEYKAKNAPQ